MQKPRNWYDDDEPVITREVHEQERDDFTGLYDQHGTPLYRQREPIGYDPHRWAVKKRHPKATRRR